MALPASVVWVAATYGLFLNDDAFITLTYAKNLAAGQGFVYNQGPATLGTTSPLLTFLVAGLSVFLPRVEIPTLAVYLTTFCWIGIAWTFYLFRATWNLSAWQAVVVGVVSLAPTATSMSPPTPVPTATPFLGLTEEESTDERVTSSRLLLWIAAGLGLVALVVVLVLAIRRGDRGKRREA